MKRNAVKRSMGAEDSAWTAAIDSPPGSIEIPPHTQPQAMFRAIHSYPFPPHNMPGMPQYYFFPANFPYPQGHGFYSFSPLTNNLEKKSDPPATNEPKSDTNTNNTEEAEQANRTQALFMKTIQFLDHFEQAPVPCGIPHENESFDILFDKFESIDSTN
jgi:hypothetical protein